MPNKKYHIVTYSDGTYAIEAYAPPVPPIDAPEPRTSPPPGWHPGPTDNPMRMYHDDKRADWGYAPRTLRLTIAITNEITPTRPTNKAQTKVYGDAKIEIPMKRRRDWLNWIYNTHGPWATERIYRPGYGYFDGAGKNPDAFTPANAFKLLLGGGQLVNGRGTTGEYTLIETQNYDAGPDYGITYQNSPHLVLKQNNVGNDKDKNMFIQVDKGLKGGVGDVYLPNCSNVVYPWFDNAPMAAVESEFLEDIPETPHTGVMYGQQVVVAEHCFSGSNTWGLVVSGLPYGWYLLEEMLVTGDPNDMTKGGSGDDRRVYITPWVFTSPIPVIGWTRQSLWYKILGWLGLL